MSKNKVEKKELKNASVQSVPEKKVETKQEEKKEIQTDFTVEINRWGDIHFSKAMKESASKLSKLEPLTPLKMTFRPNCITIISAKETKSA